MTDNNKALIEAAKSVQSRAHAPYSKFKVGAVIIADDEQQYVGCNVENAAYPLGQCAEAGAISSMIANGAKQIKEILVIGPTDELCSPCGGCRQKISEFATADTKVHMATQAGDVTTVTIAELLPYAFDKSDLTK